MKIEKYVIEQYTGMRPLRVPGSSQISPSFLKGLSFARPEGYEPVRRSALSTTSANALIEPANDYTSLVGASPDGLWVAALDAIATYRLARNLTLITDNAEAIFPSTNVSTFINGFGRYLEYNVLLGVNSQEQPVFNSGFPSLNEGTTGFLPSAPKWYEMGAMEYIWLAVVPTTIGKLVAAVDYRLAELGVTYDADDKVNSISNVFPDFTPAPGSEPAGAPDLRWEVFMRRETLYEDKSVYDNEAEDGINGLWGVSKDRTEQLISEAKTQLRSQEYRLTDVIELSDSGVVPTPAEVGKTLPDYGKVFLPSAGGVGSYHNGRVWMTAADNTMAGHYKYTRDPDYDLPNDLLDGMALMYSEIGYANLMGISSYLLLSPRSSSKITGMISVSDTLFVFGENNTYMVTGDPATDDLEVEDYPSLVGCDDGQAPAALGHTIYVVWRNRIYQLGPEEPIEVSYGVFDRHSTILGIAPDIDTNTLAVMTPEGVLHYAPDRNAWYSNETLHGGNDWPSNARLVPTPDGLLYYIEGGAAFTDGRVFGYDATEDDSDIETIIDLRSIDAGNALRADYWRAVRVPFGPSETHTGLDVDADGQSFPDSPPDAKLYYNVEGGSVDVASNPSSQEITGRREGNELVFRFPWGLLGRRIDVRIKIQMGQKTAIQPGIAFEFSPGPGSSSVGEAS